jgi:FtsP/CotA-like multicopper oxidase with cupredoxin domain
MGNNSVWRGKVGRRGLVARSAAGLLGVGMLATGANAVLAERASAPAGGDLTAQGHQGHAALAGNSTQQARRTAAMAHGGLTMPGVNGEVDHLKNGFNPSDILTDFDAGKVSTMPNGQTLHEYTFTVVNKTIEVVPGIEFPAWTYNGRIPGPTIRVREGDHLRIRLINGSDHPHSIHFHGIHPANMDGVFDEASGQVMPGKEFIYEFDAEPAGLHLYHCHTAPLAQHIAKGLYGTFIIDPKEGWPKADREFVMVMSGFDIDFDGENDFYNVNAIPFHYDHNKHPIKIKVGELVRVFLVNILEYDLINSFHLHANFFQYYPTGTSRTPSEFTDTIALMQGQRGILEFRYKYPGRYMFHAHKTEFAELGWTGVFDVEA